MSIKQISVFVENKPGSMCAMTAVLAEHNIDMRALSLAETKDFGIVRIIVDDVFDAATVLKDAGYVHSVTPVLGVSIPDTPGGLNKVLQILSDANINIEYMYAFLGGKSMPLNATNIFCLSISFSSASSAVTSSASATYLPSMISKAASMISTSPAHSAL